MTKEEKKQRLEDIREIVTEFRKGILSKRKKPHSMCFAVCAPLAGFLSFSGYDCEVTEGGVGDSNHFWITLPDGTIIDPTASQFKKPNGASMPDVYIGLKPKWYILSSKDR